MLTAHSRSFKVAVRRPASWDLCADQKKVTPPRSSVKSSAHFEARLWGAERTGLELDQGRHSVFQGNAQGKGKSHAKENNVTGQYGAHRGSRICRVCHLVLGEWGKVCFKVIMSRHGEWNSNGCGYCQTAEAVLQGKSWWLRSLISPEWSHIKFLMIMISLYRNKALIIAPHH